MSRYLRFLSILTVVIVLSAPAWATVHNVAVGNFFFNPANITVQQGDTVVWTNGAGTHSVHNTDATPPLFGNSIAAAPWTYTFVFTLPPDTYHYVCALHATLMQGTVTVQGTQSAPEPPAVVNNVELEQNYPNPFNSSTVIRFSLPNATHAKLSVLNVLGQPVTEVFNGPLSSGTHQFIFDANRLSSGMYYYRLETPQATLARKMYLIK